MGMKPDEIWDSVNIISIMATLFYVGVAVLVVHSIKEWWRKG